MLIKNSILDWLDQEEENLRAIVRQAESDRSVMSQTFAETPGDDFYMTVEDYYGFKIKDGSMEGIASGGGENYDKKLSFQQFIETRASSNIFDNDVSSTFTLQSLTFHQKCWKCGNHCFRTTITQ